MHVIALTTWDRPSIGFLSLKRNSWLSRTWPILINRSPGERGSRLPYYCLVLSVDDSWGRWDAVNVPPPFSSSVFVLEIRIDRLVCRPSSSKSPTQMESPLAYGRVTKKHAAVWHWNTFQMMHSSIYCKLTGRSLKLTNCRATTSNFVPQLWK